VSDRWHRRPDDAGGAQHDAGFSVHAKLKLDDACTVSFERQLASVAPTECNSKRLHSVGCYALENETKTAMHTTIIARATGGEVYDLRLFE
jgi:hypothetical protein